jgi:hypothetical protein
LDISDNAVLKMLYFLNNRITDIDVSNNLVLDYLDCRGNQLTTLDVSNNSVLTQLFANDNQLTEIDLSKNSILETLSLNGNQLTALDVSKNTALDWIDCRHNYMKTTADVIGWQTHGLILDENFLFNPQRQCIDCEKFPCVCDAPPVDATGVTLNKTTATIKASMSETLIATVAPDNATNKVVTWASDDTSVATVDNNGKITAIAAGTATITVTTADGDFTDTCEVTVIDMLNYGEPDVEIIGRTFSFRSGKEIPPNATPNNNAVINLTKETLTVEGFTIQAYSTDGGVKWTAGNITQDAFVRLLNRNLELWICFRDYNANAKKPQGSGDEYNIIAFAPINGRATTPRLAINYLIAADSTGATSGEWVLTDRNALAVAVRTGIEIGMANSTGRVVNDRGFGRFYNTGGIPVIELTGTRPTRTNYFVRATPTVENGVYTAASRPRRIAVSSELRAPRLTVRTRNNVSTIRARAGMNIKIGNNRTLHDRDSARTPIDITAAVAANTRIEAWTAATVRRPASAKQILR